LSNDGARENAKWHSFGRTRSGLLQPSLVACYVYGALAVIVGLMLLLFAGVSGRAIPSAWVAVAGTVVAFGTWFVLEIPRIYERRVSREQRVLEPQRGSESANVTSYDGHIVASECDAIVARRACWASGAFAWGYGDDGPAAPTFADVTWSQVFSVQLDHGGILRVPSEFVLGDDVGPGGGRIFELQDGNPVRVSGVIERGEEPDTVAAVAAPYRNRQSAWVAIVSGDDGAPFRIRGGSETVSRGMIPVPEFVVDELAANHRTFNDKRAERTDRNADVAGARELRRPVARLALTSWRWGPRVVLDRFAAFWGVVLALCGVTVWVAATGRWVEAALASVSGVGLVVSMVARERRWEERLLRKAGMLSSVTSSKRRKAKKAQWRGRVVARADGGDREWLAWRCRWLVRMPGEDGLPWYKRWSARYIVRLYDCGAQQPFVVRCDDGSLLLVEAQRLLLERRRLGCRPDVVLVLRHGHTVRVSGWWRRATPAEVLRAQRISKSKGDADVWVPAARRKGSSHDVVVRGGVMEGTARLSAPVELLENCLPVTDEGEERGGRSR
jgi:hypothetical protein